ncbi:2-oxo acid dehydrogenase subunit E2 [Pusillimonas sp. TS35]|uniref:dihydrolipoamide acetyltransferase family protein n=1 Tax=Paracandidimonas lactea TaxID=2895524 RepID=UPI001371D391|nr:dihydrolipoamide acetyltransferase family protein [Paracandidimonas lactea]MYN15083.1 2-oxo acid dehydrogenase subunit E2 [Pusillimonas sp. TS35]
MGVHIIKMPDIGEGIAEVELVEWHVKPGDAVTEDQVLADVMTDKATVQIPSPVHGTVTALGGKVGEVMAVGAELIRLEVEGEGNEHLHRDRERGHAAAVPSAAAGAEVQAFAPPAAEAKAPGAGDAAPRDQEGARDVGAAVSRLSPNDGGIGASASGVAGNEAASPAAPERGDRAAPAIGGAQSGAGTMAIPRAAAAVPALSGATELPARPHGGRPLASPAVRKRAWDLGLELQYVAGTGPAGQITHADIDRHLARAQGGAAAPASGARGYARRDDEQKVQVVGLRRKIAERMQESKRRIPHFSYVEEVDVTELEALRTRMNAQWGGQRGRLTLLPFLARAIVVALRDFPHINARYDDDGGIVTRYGAVHLGVAAQTDAGLMVPVLRHAETMDVWACSAEIARLAEAVRGGRASRDELTGSTITLSSLGALGGLVSTPVINYPEVAIVGVNRIVERPVILQGAVVARKMMNLSSSFDHRVVDGMDAAQFIQRIRGCLECPALLFVE